MSEIRPVDGEEVIELTVGEDASGVRVDAYMRTMTSLSRSRIASLIGQGALLIDGTPETKPARKLEPGERIVLTIPPVKLLGDRIYAPHLKTAVQIPRLMLHAYSLSFTHPSTGERMTFTAPLPPAYEQILKKLASASM